MAKQTKEIKKKKRGKSANPELVLDKFVPSKYQKDIFEFIKNGKGNLLIEASAGSGKTTTIVHAISLLEPDKKILFAAFNRDIVSSLSKKTKKYPNVNTMTIHQLGYAIIRRCFDGMDIELEPFKYDSYIRNNLDILSSLDLMRMKYKDKMTYISNIKKFVDFGRFYLAATLKDLDFIQDRYDIETIGDEKEIALNVMQWGKANFEMVDFTDMVWLPIVCDMDTSDFIYDYIMIDEVQDLDKSKRILMQKCAGPDTRIFAVGDPNQCIYSFSGSDPQSFEEFRKIPNTTCFPLSISYRCADKIVDFAKRMVPSIERNEDGREGEVVYDCKLEDVHEDDMILCRNNAPLIDIYTKLLQEGKPCRILGKDWGSSLVSVIRSFHKDKLALNLLSDGLFVRLYEDLFTTRNKLIEIQGIDKEMATSSQQVTSKLDTIMTLSTLAVGLNTSEELINKINTIFKEKKNTNGIILSTIHKAKGLEANNVYIAEASLMPSKAARKRWEIEQEKNLMYVSYTRPKNKLGFLMEDKDGHYDASNKNTMKRLDAIEKVINNTLHKKTTTPMSNMTAATIVRMSEILGDKKTKTPTLGELQNKLNDNNMLFNPIKKRKKVNKNKLWEN